LCDGQGIQTVIRNAQERRRSAAGSRLLGARALASPSQPRVRAKKIADIIQYERGVSADTALDDHQISLIVNQLRDRIAHIIVPYLRRAK
jgi:hypothetical protein